MVKFSVQKNALKRTVQKNYQNVPSVINHATKDIKKMESIIVQKNV
jgi:hypothetical protein